MLATLEALVYSQYSQHCFQHIIKPTNSGNKNVSMSMLTSYQCCMLKEKKSTTLLLVSNVSGISRVSIFTIIVNPNLVCNT